MTKRRALLILPLTAALAVCSDAPVDTTQPEVDASWIGNGYGRGIHDAAGLREALDAASRSHRPTVIRLKRGTTIELGATVTHTGSAPLVIDGRGGTIVGPTEGDGLAFVGGADLTFRNLPARGDGGNGIYVEVPAARTGTVRVEANDLTARDNGFAGLWVDDQVYDSPASISARLVRSTFTGNNTAGIGEALDYDQIVALADKDGLRVNEGGPGDLHVFIAHSAFFENQADGVEVDETGPGSVYSQVVSSRFDDNGDQLQFPDEVPPGFPDDPSEYEKDLEDGFDIDENDEGGVWARFRNVTANGNEDEGIDLDETFDGSIEMVGSHVVANDNFGAGIQLTESEDEPGSDGHVIVRLLNVEANDSRDSRGIRLEEFQAGDVLGRIVRGTFHDNDSDGVRIEEYGDGRIDFHFNASAFTGNGGEGLQAEENGTLSLVRPTFADNGDGPEDDIDADDDVEVIRRGG